MARPVILGNGALTVGLNEHGLVNDFYYPYVGLDNLTTARSVHHKVGVWVDGRFSWVEDGTWDTNVTFEDDALISTVSMSNKTLQIDLLFQDFVDNDINAFCRKVNVTNHADASREIRLFMHQVFEISRGGRADTALYVPDGNYILDYKGRCCLLIYGQTSEGSSYDQFAIGNYGIEGKEGTFKDAEDGELSGSAVEHGGVDSVMRFKCEIEAGSTQELHYWIVASDSQFYAEKIHLELQKDGLNAHLNKTRTQWQQWLSTSADKLRQIDPEYIPHITKSLMVIKAHTDRRGGIIASCDSSIYNYGRDYYSYVWPRDGAYAIWPLIRLGFTEEPKKFFEFCRDIMTQEGFLMHKYQPDRAIGSTWHPLIHNNRRELAIQEDETAIIVYMLGEYLDATGDAEFVRSLYQTFIEPAANFMSSFTDPETNLPHASYDLWEEKFLTSTYTVAVVYQSLLVAADLAEKFEFADHAVRWRAAAEQMLLNSEVLFDPERKAYRKGYLLQPDGSLQFDNTLDISSLYGVMMFGLRKNGIEQIQQSLECVEKVLLDQSPAGGSPRYEHDHYFESDTQYMGNPWFVTTLWLAQYYARIKNYDKAKGYVNWSINHMLPSGVLSEQVNPTTGEHVSVTPLVWSHAELINTILDISK